MMEKFHYPLPDGQELVLPKFKHLPMSLVRKHRDEAPGGQILAYLEALVPEQLALVDSLDLEQFGEMTKAWQKDSQLTPGESQASSS